MQVLFLYLNLIYTRPEYDVKRLFFVFEIRLLLWISRVFSFRIQKIVMGGGERMSEISNTTKSKAPPQAHGPQTAAAVTALPNEFVQWISTAFSRKL